MEPWIWAIVGIVPVVAVGAAYAMGAFSVESSPSEPLPFEGDTEMEQYGGRRKKTRKSKSKHKKTKRRR